MTSPRVRKKFVGTRLAEATIIEEVKPESVASILEHDIEITIQNWLKLVEQDAELTRIPLSRNERMGHLGFYVQPVVSFQR